ncbi:hypothetical protein MXB_1865 [Myxobolus squamalis]|nr:hypothetical protein MXB_1865 [Myxobolus squamalis]
MFGLNRAKLAVVCAIVGGTQVVDLSTGVMQRGESHVLLVGDPGCGKSQLLKQACKVMPRSILTSGTGTTSAGLTASVVKEAGFSHWNLEAGALPSVNRGICCIDEFNSLRKVDKTSIHEAMEQQTISVAKAGIICHLQTQVSILAACNMKKGKEGNLCDMIGVPSPLLSRFDLVICIKDCFDRSIDSSIADFILEDNSIGDSSKSHKSIYEFPWSTEIMCNYIALAKELKPTLTESSSQILKKYYQVCRIKSGRDTSRTTIRMLESLTRIATAHAKLMFHSEVTIDDTLASIDLMNHSLSSDSVFDDRDFTINNKESLDEIAYEKILEDLCLQNRSSLMKKDFKCIKSKKMDKEIMELLNESQENTLPLQVTLKNPTIIPKVTASTFTFDLDENFFNDLGQSTIQANTPIDPTYKRSKNSFHEKLKEFKR